VSECPDCKSAALPTHDGCCHFCGTRLVDTGPSMDAALVATTLQNLVPVTLPDVAVTERQARELERLLEEGEANE
jgi:hypothetical protein